MENRGQKSLNQRIILSVIGLLSIIGSAIVVFNTTRGAWGYSDSIAYITSARNLLRGIGLGYYYPSGRFYILTHYPPLYPLVLAGLGLLQVDLVVAARWLSILLFAGTLFGAGLVFLRYSPSPWLAILGSLLIGIFPTSLMMCGYAMSEPLFVFLFVLAGFSLVGYFQSENYRRLILAAFVTGLLPFTRYIGLANIGAMAVCVLLFSSGKWKVRLGKTALFGFIASLPILIWVIWVYTSVDRSLAGRGLGVNWNELSRSFLEFRAVFLNTVWLWLPFGKFLIPIHSRIRILSLLLVAAGITLATLLAERHLRKGSSQPVTKGDLQIFSIFGLSSLAYVAALVLTFLFTRPAPDIDNRMLLPLYTGLVLCLLAAFSSWANAWFRERLRWLMVIPWLIGVVIVYWYSADVLWQVKYFHKGGGDINYSWKDSETIAAVRDLPPDVPVISDKAALLLLWADRPAYEMMNSFPPDFVNQSAPYGEDEMDSAQIVFRQQGAALVLFRGHLSAELAQDYGEKGKERMDSLLEGLILLGQYSDGAIYLYPTATP